MLNPDFDELRPNQRMRALADLAVLQGRVPDAVLKKQYVEPIERREPGAIPELFAVARASSRALGVEPHAKGRGSKRCDARISFESADVYVEVKHQRDLFPFNSPGFEASSGITLYAGSRPGADPRYTGQRSDDTTEKLPGSTIWRECLEEAASQLPREQPGFIMVSCDADLDVEDHIIDALFGDPVVVASPHPRGWGSTMEEGRLRNGIFNEETFSHVAGVYFFRLKYDGQSDATLCDWARGALNPKYSGRTLPNELTYALPNVHGEVRTEAS